MAPITTRDSVHDWSYHFVTLLFDEFLENLRLTLKVIRGHLSHFTGETQYHWNYYGHSLDPTGNIKGHTVGEKMTYDQAIYRQMAISLDVTTAKLIQILLLHKKGMIDRCQSEIRWMETYLRGVSFESIQKILPFECHLEEKIELPANLGIHLNSGLMDYCFEKLRQLNELAESLKNAELILYRKQVFEQLLSNHCLFLG